MALVHPFDKLPPEIWNQVYSRYCTGKDLSTLAIAFASSTEHEHRVEGLASVLRTRLDAKARSIEVGVAEGTLKRQCLGAADWIRSIARAKDASSIRVLSENAAVVDLLDHIRDGMWPVWAGHITVDSFITGTRLRNTARVVLRAPLGTPTLLPGSSLVRRGRPSGLFRCEPYNLVPLPPWGRLDGMSDIDRRVLRPVAQRLRQSGQVAVPQGYNSTGDLLNCRILSTHQVERRTLARDRLPGTHDHDEDGLMCCWHGDAEEDLGSDRDYIDYIIDLLNAMDHLEGMNVSREYTPMPPIQHGSYEGHR